VRLCSTRRSGIRGLGRSLRPETYEIRYGSPAWGPSLQRTARGPGIATPSGKRGKMRSAALSCASCRTRLTRDGTVIRGAQGNFLLDRALGFIFRAAPPQAARDARLGNYRLFGAPWLHPETWPPQGDKSSIRKLPNREDRVPDPNLFLTRSSLWYLQKAGSTLQSPC
jgi:hypothetical protein